MIRRFLLSIITFCVLLLLAAQALAGRQDVKSAPAAPAAVSNDVVVKVLGKTVTEKQVLNTINQIVAQASRTQQVTTDQIQKKDTFFYKQAIDTIVGTILLSNEAKENKLTVDKAQVDNNMKSIRAQFPDDVKFQAVLSAQGTTEDELRSSIETDLLCTQMIDIITKDLPAATDADIQKFYDENPKYFNAELVHAAEIFMRVDKNATPDQKNEIRKKLETLRTNIDSKSITFADAAKSNSDEKTSAQKGGDLGMVARGGLIKPLEDPVFSAQPNTLTPVIETEYGYYLFYVSEHNKSGTAPLDLALIVRIKNYLEARAKQDATLKHLDALKTKTPIETVMSDEEWNKRHAAK